jgi:hypothetical protein
VMRLLKAFKLFCLLQDFHRCIKLRLFLFSIISYGDPEHYRY